MYFGRCLGAFTLVVEFMMFRGALTGQNLSITFQVLLLSWALMIVIHVVGAVERSQPFTETLEIGFWVILFVLTLAFWPGA